MIVTGVPRSPDYCARGHLIGSDDAGAVDQKILPKVPPPRNDYGTKVAPAEPAPLEWTKVQTQVSPPDERSCGIIIEGARAVAGNQLHVRDHEGRTW